MMGARGGRKLGVGTVNGGVIQVGDAMGDRYLYRLTMAVGKGDPLESSVF